MSLCLWSTEMKPKFIHVLMELLKINPFMYVTMAYFTRVNEVSSNFIVEVQMQKKLAALCSGRGGAPPLTPPLPACFYRIQGEIIT